MSIKVPAPVPPRKAGGRTWKLDETNPMMPSWRSGGLLVFYDHISKVFVWDTMQMIGYEKGLKEAMLACVKRHRIEIKTLVGVSKK